MTSRDVLPIQPEQPEDAQLAARMAALYESTPMPDESFAARCSAYVFANATKPRHRFSVGLPNPRWWLGVAAAAMLITATTWNWPSAGDSSSPSVRDFAPDVAVVTVPQGSVTALKDNAVRFDIVLPSSAKGVSIVGDFNGWDEHATPMSQQGDGWSAKIPLTPGRHVYAFVVDGKKWIVDPLAPQVPSDGFGPTNAVIVDGGTP